MEAHAAVAEEGGVRRGDLVIGRLARAGHTSGGIVEAVRELIGAGELAPGDALPPIRDLAVQLDVNRNTVGTAYRLLVTTGIAQAQGRRGTVISGPPPLNQDGAGRPGLIDLASGNPDPTFLPDIPAALRAMTYHPPMYDAEPVLSELARWAQEDFTATLGRCEEVLVSHGAVDGIERVLTAHLTRGDRVAVEDPCFLATLDTLRLNGFRPVPVSVDAEGMTVPALDAALAAGARTVVLTPRAHNPTGATLSASRAKRLSALLARYPDVLVVEDDHFWLLANTPPRSVITTHTRRYAVLRSFAKAFGPDMRVALVSTDADTATRMRTRLRPGAGWVSHLLQTLALQLLRDPTAQELTRHARDAYAERRALLGQLLERRGVGLTVAGEGLNLWLPTSTPARLVDDLSADGWSVRDGQAFGVLTPAAGVRVTTADLSPDRAEAVADAVARQCLRQS